VTLETRLTRREAGVGSADYLMSERLQTRAKQWRIVLSCIKNRRVASSHRVFVTLLDRAHD
jgi:hypothetical protein